MITQVVADKKETHSSPKQPTCSNYEGAEFEVPSAAPSVSMTRPCHLRTPVST